MDKLYTMETLAEYLGVSVRTILREKAAGKLVFRKIRGQVRFTQEDIEQYLSGSSYLYSPGQKRVIAAPSDIKTHNRPPQP